MKALMKVAFFGSAKVMDSTGKQIGQIGNQRSVKDRFMRPMENSFNEFGYTFTGGLIGAMLSAKQRKFYGNTYVEANPIFVSAGNQIGRVVYDMIKVKR